MSLRSVHIAFILTALALLVYMAGWSGARVFHGQNSGNGVMLAASVLGAAAGGRYLLWFLRKTASPR